MKICWFGAYKVDYSRNCVLMEGLKSNDVEIVEGNTNGDTGYKKYYNQYKKLKELQNDYDILYCAFPVNLNIIIAKLFQKKPIASDCFFPLQDSVVYDRKAAARFSFRSFFCYVVDFLSVHLADLIVVDTYEHQQYWQKKYHCNNKKFIVIPVGVNTNDFNSIQPKMSEGVTVQYHGSYIPLQGVDIVLQAVKLIQDIDRYQKVKFRFTGSGELLNEMKTLASDLKVNVEFHGRLPKAELFTQLNDVDVVLGIFGNTKKTDRVVPNKLYEGVALKKVVISKENDVLKRYFTKEEVYMVENTPQELATGLMTLIDDAELRNKFARLGNERLMKNYTHEILGASLKKELKTLCTVNA